MPTSSSVRRVHFEDGIPIGSSDPRLGLPEPTPEPEAELNPEDSEDENFVPDYLLGNITGEWASPRGTTEQALRPFVPHWKPVGRKRDWTGYCDADPHCIRQIGIPHTETDRAHERIHYELGWPGHTDYRSPDELPPEARAREGLRELLEHPFDHNKCDERCHGTPEQRLERGNYGKLWFSLWYRLLVSMGQLNRIYHSLLKLLRSWIRNVERTGSKCTWRVQQDYLGRPTARVYGPHTNGLYEFERGVVRFWDSYITYQEYWRIYRDLVGEWIPRQYRSGENFAAFGSWCWTVPVAPLLAL